MRLREITEQERASNFQIIGQIARLFDEAAWSEEKADKIVSLLKQHGYDASPSMSGMALYGMLHGKPESYLNTLRNTIEEIAQ